MIITCPACSTRYSVDSVNLGTVRVAMRCSACSHQWHLMPQAEPELPSTPPTAAPVTSPKPQPE
ncbi:MAG: zinc-ribbon domain-containing protein, partial [Rhodospirillales bacterium]